MRTSSRYRGPVSISEKTSFRKISLSLEAARFVFRIVRSLWNLTGTSAAVLPMCLSNFKAIWQFKVPISWLRDFTRSYEKTSFRILRRGPVVFEYRRYCSRCHLPNFYLIKRLIYFHIFYTHRKPSDVSIRPRKLKSMLSADYILQYIIIFKSGVQNILIMLKF